MFISVGFICLSSSKSHQLYKLLVLIQYLMAKHEKKLYLCSILWEFVQNEIFEMTDLCNTAVYHGRNFILRHS